MAAEGIGVNITAEIIASLIKKAAHQARYLFCFNNIVETLGKKKQELIETEQSIEERAERAHRRIETIGDEVRKWLKDAENLITEVDKLQEATNIHSAGRGWCPNCIQRYRLGRRVAKKTEELKQVIGNCNFSEFARLATLRGMEYYSSEGFISFESRKRAYDQIMEALKDDGIRRIGVHGMGGSGKTTLVKEVGKEAEKLRLFEKVLIVVVSNHPDIRKIQDSIAGSLGIEFKLEKNEPERARRLSMALSDRGKILVILDDVWERLDFEVIGIPNNSYILLTTRESSVCSTMECENVIPLSVLDDRESWILFQKHAGITDDSFDIFKDVGKEIANECKGLPVAIAAVASSLKGKELVEWEEARYTLRDSRPMNIEPGLRDPYKCLQLSYDNIRSEEVKSVFLLCSFFQEDDEISVEYLTRFAIGLGLFGKVDSNKRARNQVSVTKNKLIDSCLLMKGDRENCIKMHDLVRDVALWIAKNENKLILGVERNKKELQEHSILKDTTIKYLWCKVDKFLDQLDCPKLEFLWITISSGHHVEVPNEFFSIMKELKVLVLGTEAYNHPILQLSMPIQSLTNLCYLMLVGWQLGDISFVCSLKTIESLMLLNCSFHELPDGVANLKYLRLLELRKCKIEKNPCAVIERSSQLEELYFVSNTWEDKGKNNVEFFGKYSDTSVLKLQRYHIEIGKSFKELNHNGYSITRYLSVQYFDTCSSYATIDDLMRRAEVLSLGGIHTGCKSIIPDLVQKIGGGVNEFTKLIVHDSDEVECVVGITNSFYQISDPLPVPQLTVFSNLTYLQISWMKRLQNFFLGRPHHGLFEKLEELHISSCHQLKHIIANDAEDIISDDDNPMSYNPLFPKLKKLCFVHCEQLEYLMPISYARGLLQLENLEIQNASQLKYVFCQSSHENEDLLCNQNENEFHIIKFHALKSLQLVYLPNIISICPESYYPIWPSLDSLEFTNCPHLNIMLDGLEFRQRDHTITKNGIIFCNLTKLDFQGLNCLETLFLGPPHHGGFEKLEELHISYCHQLKHIIANEEEEIISVGDNPRSYNSIFPKLKVIVIRKCEQLEYLMPVSFARGLLQLEKLEIRDASQLKYVFGQSNHEAEDLLCNQNENGFHIVELETLKSLEFVSLPTIISICPESYYPIWPSLDSLEFSSCPQLYIMLAGLEFRQQDHTITKNGIVFCNLTKLQFWGLNHLETLFLSPPHHGGFEKLEELHISYCDKLTHILANEAEGIISDDDNQLFPKLKKLFIGNCEQLKYLMPISYARRLLQLEKLDIVFASQLKYVFCQSNHVDEFHVIKFHALKSLQLVGLPNIISIFPENCYPTWPSLESLRLWNYPQVDIKNCIVGLELRQQDPTITKELGAAIVSRVQNLKSLSVGENSEIDGLFDLQGLPMDGQQVTAGLIYLNLYCLPELKYIWKAYKHFLCLQNLQSLSIERCGKLKVIFSTSILISLNQLKKLEIIKCEELQQIIEEDEENKNLSNSHSGQVCLPQLTSLYVEECNKLKCLFPFTPSVELPKLTFLTIKEASELEEVISCEKGDTKEQVQVKFPELEHLILVQLPNLREVYKGIELETVRNRVVLDCPKLSLMSSVTLENLRRIYEDRELDWRTYNLLYPILKDYSKEIKNENLISKTASSHQMGLENLDTNIRAALEIDSIPQYDQNDNCIKSKEFLTVERRTEQTPKQKLSPIAYDLNLTEINKEPMKEFVEAIEQKIQVITTSSNDSQATTRPSLSHLAIPLCTTPSLELLDEQPMSGTSLMDQQEAVGEIEIHFQTSQETNIIKETVEASDQEGPKSDKIGIAPLSTDLKPRNPSPGPLIVLLQNPEKVQEQNIPPIGSLRLRESIKETAMESDGKGLAPGKSTVATSGEASTAHLPTSIAVAQNVHAQMPVAIPNTPIHAPAPQVDPLCSSTGNLMNNSEEEYAAFRDIGAIKKKHIPLLEHAFANHSSLWAWREKFKHPQIKQLGYTILGDMLEFLASTRWRDLTEEKKAKFESLVNDMEAFGFDIQWLGNTRVEIRQSKLDEDSINCKKTLEEQLVAEQNKVEDMEVHLQKAKAKMQKIKVELDDIEAKLGNFNDFIGF